VSGTLIRSGFSSDDGTERLPLAWKDLLRDVYLQDEIVLLFDLLRPIFNRSKSQVIWKQPQVPSKEQNEWSALYQAGSHKSTLPIVVRSASPEPCGRRYLE